jgi:uncharacterized protein YjbI with pentapeptide repeats
MAKPEHLAILRQGVPAWEEWLEHKANFVADFKAANLGGLDLSGIDLRGANLSHADLVNTNLSGAQVNRANLRSSRLAGARLTNADLSKADLDGAQLSPVRPDSTVLEEGLDGIDASGAKLIEANLTGANLVKINLTNSDLRQANLSDSEPLALAASMARRGAGQKMRCETNWRKKDVGARSSTSRLKSPVARTPMRSGANFPALTSSAPWR